MELKAIYDLNMSTVTEFGKLVSSEVETAKAMQVSFAETLMSAKAPEAVVEATQSFLKSSQEEMVKAFEARKAMTEAYIAKFA